jgi:hypothetical protein
MTPSQPGRPPVLVVGGLKLSQPDSFTWQAAQLQATASLVSQRIDQGHHLVTLFPDLLAIGWALSHVVYYCFY